ncbi:unnamed protein product [Effrenium voratum]|nr:unnamed protein product [Effrenium voratum]
MAERCGRSPSRAKAAGPVLAEPSKGYSLANAKLPSPLRFLRRSNSLVDSEPAILSTLSPRSKARPRPPLPTLPPKLQKADSKRSSGSDAGLAADRSVPDDARALTPLGEKMACLARTPAPGLRALSRGERSASDPKLAAFAGPGLRDSRTPVASPAGVLRDKREAGPKVPPPLPPLDRMPTSMPEHVLEARRAARQGTRLRACGV